MACPNASVTCFWKIKNFTSFTNTLIKHGTLKRTFKTIIEPCGSPIEWILELSSEKTKFYRLALKLFYWKARWIQCECELSILANDGKNFRYHKVLNAHEFSSSSCICADYTVPISEIHGEKKDIFLPQDTLTVLCRIWQLGLPSDQWFFSTTVHSESYLWSIKQFSNTQKVTRKKFKLASFEFEVELHRDTLTREAFVNTEIRKGNYSGICNLCLTVNNQKSKDFEVSLFIPNFWKYLVNISDILSEHYLENDTLHLKWTFTAPVDDSSSEAAEAVPTPISQMSATPAPYRETIRVPPNTLQERMLHLYQGGKFSDATLSSSGVWFPIHKGILCSISPVFCAMLEGDNRESRTGTVAIPDIEPNTLEQMLIYVYTDVLGYLGWKEVSKLYYAADKYDIPSLKDKCRSVLKAELSVDNACDLIALADTHQDHGLMGCVVDFVCDYDEVICSRGWKFLEETNPRLTTKIFRDMHFKKRNDSE